jgi:hypothetical protein
MELTKWVERKYPESKNMIFEFLNPELLKEFKDNKYRLGILKESLIYPKYKKGTIFMFHHQKENETNQYEYYCVFKCKKGYTQSGYHGFTKTSIKFTEILK